MRIVTEKGARNGIFCVSLGGIAKEIALGCDSTKAIINTMFVSILCGMVNIILILLYLPKLILHKSPKIYLDSLVVFKRRSKLVVIHERQELVARL